MQPTIWKPPIELSKQEEQVVSRIRRTKLFVFLRTSRHEVFEEVFQQQLATLYRPSKRGHPPIAPAQLALAVILQAYMGVSDDEVIEAMLMDRRWQVVLDCLDTDQAPFSKGTAYRSSVFEQPPVNYWCVESGAERSRSRSCTPLDHPYNTTSCAPWSSV